MDRRDTQKVDMLIHRLSLKYMLPKEIIRNIISSPYIFADGIIRELNLDNISTEEDLKNKKTNFNFKGFGKLYVSYPLLKNRNRRINNMNDLNIKKWKKKK